MKSNKIDATVDMIICMATKDLSKEDKISEDEARNKIMSSKAIEILYDESNKLWTEGPDSFLKLYREIG